MPSSVKRIKGIEYRYYTYYIEGKRYDVYCGPARKPESEIRVLEAEIDYTKQQSKRFAQRTNELENQLKNIKNKQLSTHDNNMNITCNTKQAHL